MRYIGDWSSDVCSSDLGMTRCCAVRDNVIVKRCLPARAPRSSASFHVAGRHGARSIAPSRSLDRKSVVKGKRVGVGGRGRSEKKKRVESGDGEKQKRGD